jgi:hypothetical protein
MSLTLSDEQLAEIRRGGTISVRSPDDQQLVICSQSEFPSVIRVVVQKIHGRLGDQLTADELQEEIEEALVQKAWVAMGRQVAIRQIQEDQAAQ